MAEAVPSLAPDAHTGRRLGKYEIACKLSQGGMSQIFLAYQRGVAGFRKYVVLKQILPNIQGQDAAVRMFVAEARITAGFAHPHIAQVFDLDVADGELFLVMEFVPGATLVEIAKACLSAREAIPIGLTLRVVRDTALALHYAHTFVDPAGRKQPVIHRDVAEKNVMVTFEGVTKLLDFGIAKRVGGPALTQVGTVKGTTGYMSPEQIRGEPLDARSDVFALGVVLHECLAGQRLFHRKNRDEELKAPLHQTVSPPSRYNKRVTPELDTIALTALERERDLRFPTAREFARAIERAAAPLLWEPEECGALVQRLFAPRREQVRLLLSDELGFDGDNDTRFTRALSAEMVSAMRERVSSPAAPKLPPPLSAPVSSPPVPHESPLIPLPQKRDKQRTQEVPEAVDKTIAAPGGRPAGPHEALTDENVPRPAAPRMTMPAPGRAHRSFEMVFRTVVDRAKQLDQRLIFAAGLLGGVVLFALCYWALA